MLLYLSLRFEQRKVEMYNDFLSLSPRYGFDSCSFLKNKNATPLIVSWANNAIQNQGCSRPFATLTLKLGKTGPGPILFGPNPLAAIVAMDPRTCAVVRVKVM
jgi:hypothetical protein